MMLAKLLTIACCLIVGIAVPVSAQSPHSRLDDIKARGYMVAGVAPDAPPMGSVGLDGKPVGFAPDLARLVAKSLGVEVRFKPITTLVLMPSILNGDIDIMFGSTTPTRKREEAVDFSIVYNWDYLVPLVKAGASTRIADYVAPKTVSTTKNNYAAELFLKAVPLGKVTFLEQYDDAVNALAAGQTNAVLMNKFSATIYVQRYPGQFQIGDIYSSDPQAMVLPQNDSKWRNYINWTIQELWARGQFAEAYRRNFGYEPDFKLWSPSRLQPGIEP